ncbi:hypothetical protein [Niabella aquatica]
MKKQETLTRAFITVAAVTLLLLMVPFIAMQLTSQVRWSVGDFMIMGSLLSGTGIAYKMLVRKAPNWIYRIGVMLALGTTFFMVWANMAVGLIGNGAGLANMMYGIIVLIVVIGAVYCRFRPAGMGRVMYAAVLALILSAIIAFIMNLQHYTGSSAHEILFVSGFFAALFLVAGALFRHSAREEKTEQSCTGK